MNKVEPLLKQFFYKPMSRFGVRGLARETKLDTKTVMKYLKELSDRKIIIKLLSKNSFPYYEANRLSLSYRFEKSHVLIKKIIESGLIEFIENKINPKAIVLFGSAAKGTYHEKSDVDIFVQAKYKKLELSKFKYLVRHKISLFFEDDAKNLSKGLLENIYNGEVLSGKLEVV